VYDYVAGKVDWIARGLPTEGEKADVPRVGRLARDDVATCALDEPPERVRDLIEASPYGFALVLAEDRTVLGRIRRSTLKMEPGPSTVRYDLAVDELRKRLEKRDLKTAIVTTPEGRLVGVVRRSDLAG
jgi:CBS-domain-containing membrane protein